MRPSPLSPTDVSAIFLSSRFWFPPVGSSAIEPSEATDKLRLLPLDSRFSLRRKEEGLMEPEELSSESMLLLRPERWLSAAIGCSPMLDWILRRVPRMDDLSHGKASRVGSFRSTGASLMVLGDVSRCGSLVVSWPWSVPSLRV